MSEREDENEDVFESNKDRHRASKGVVFEFPPRQHNNLKPFLVRKPMSSKSNGEDPSPMWSVGSSSSPPMMSNYTGNGNYNGSSVYLGNGLSTAARKSSTMPHSPPWDVGTTSRSNATMRYTDRWNSMHRNEMMAIRSSTRRQWSWGSLVYGMFVCGCCNVGGLFFGSIATVIAMLQYTDHKSADYSRAARKRRISLCLSSVGLILGLMTLAVLLLLYFFLPSVHIAVNDIFSSIQTSVRQRNITSSGHGNSSSNAKTST